MASIRIVSWNISAGREAKSLEQFDYLTENLSYFTSKIKETHADVVCLQEVHFNSKRSQAREIAQELGLKSIFESPRSPSHINKDYLMENAILTELEILQHKTYQYPYPKFPLVFADGRPAAIHNQNLQVAMLPEFNVANTQLLPLGLFGYNYFQGLGREFGAKFEQTLKVLKTPLLLCGDFSGDFENDKVELVFNKVFPKLGLKDALPEVVTRPTNDGKKHKNDHIFYSKDFIFRDARVIPTNTDHYLCVADFDYQ